MNTTGGPPLDAVISAVCERIVFGSTVSSVTGKDITVPTNNNHGHARVVSTAMSTATIGAACSHTAYWFQLLGVAAAMNGASGVVP